MYPVRVRDKINRIDLIGKHNIIFYKWHRHLLFERFSVFGMLCIRMNANVKFVVCYNAHIILNMFHKHLFAVIEKERERKIWQKSLNR